MYYQLQFSFVFLTLLAFIPTASADDTDLLDNAVNGTTLALIRVDSSRIELSPKLLELAQRDPSGALGELTRIATAPVQQVKEILQGEQAYMAVDLPYSPRFQSRLLVSTNVPETKLNSLAQLIWPQAIGQASHHAGWRMITVGMSKGAIAAPPISTDLISAQTTPWESALQATKSFPMQMAVVYPEYVRETITETELELPAMLGGGSAKTLISGVEWLSLGFDPQNATIKLIAQTESTETAEAIKTHLPKLFHGLLEQGMIQESASAMAKSVLGLLQPQVHGTQVVLSLEDPKQAESLLQLAAAAIAATAEPLSVSQTQNNLKQFALALHNHESALKALPTYKNPEQSKGLSWRVHILPFIAHADLYNEFHLDEPWDSSHNIRLLDRMPEVFKPVIPIGSTETHKPNHTTYVAPIGPKTVFGQDKIIRFQDVTDGTSNTIIFVELKPEHAIPWTSPEEYPFDPANPATKLRSINDRVSVAYMDGSVRGIQIDEPIEVWNAIFSRNGVEVVNVK